MRTHRAEPRNALLLAVVAVAATAVLLATGGQSAGRTPSPLTSAAGWRGLVGSRPHVALGNRVIVVLKTPSLAQRVAAAGGIVGTVKERAWTNATLAAQKLLFFEAVEHARHRRNAHLADSREARHRVRPFEPQHEHGFPLHAGEFERLHVQVYAAHQRTRQHFQLPADLAMHVIFGRRHRIGVFANASGGGAHRASNGTSGRSPLSGPVQ